MVCKAVVMPPALPGPPTKPISIPLELNLTAAPQRLKFLKNGNRDMFRSYLSSTSFHLLWYSDMDMAFPGRLSHS